MAVSGSETVTVNAPADQVLAFLRDVGNQKNWFPGNTESEVLATNEDGQCTRAKLVNDVKVAKDTFELDYTHRADGFDWKLAEPTSIQKSQSGSWTVKGSGGKCEVTMSLELETSLPLPGIIQKKTMKDTLKGATKALAKQF